MAPHILIILGSTRQGRKGEAVAHWFMQHAGQRTEATFELVDLRDWPLPFLDAPVPPASGQYDPTARPWAEKIATADGFVFVMPEYNHGYPAVLKNAIDHIYYEWAKKPAAIVSYGSHAAGYRGAEQLRQVLIELEVAPIRAQVGIPRVWAAFDEQGNIHDTAHNRAAGAVLDELIWWSTALKTAREAALQAAV
jgi:NAD(P)H-dependent FMN reductase